ncbi:MAG TPA: NAD(P)-dependent oxidoreductase, partial [Actinomycetota bacterium]|nr:NAD(P)-dependent oxidoreductase [Actinomycetota bacterium]
MPDAIFLAEAAQAEATRLRAALEAAGVHAELRSVPDPVRGQPSPGLGAGVGVLSVFVGSRVDQATLDACPDLRLVATRSTGYDHVDLAACTARGVAVANVPTYGENTVAEHTFALILALSRNVHKAWVRTQRGDFSIQGLQGFDLRGRTIGLIGVGHIGLHTAKIARGFGMRVLASDPRPQPLLAELVGFRYVELDELVASADIVSLHAPLVPATRHLVDRELLKRFKRGALLVNTARGGLVDTEALLWALDEGILAGAGLDVLEGEELLTEDRRRLALERDEASLR